MLRVTNLAVRSLDVDYLDLFWEVENTFEDPLDFTFVVERSESPLGPWDPVSEPFSDRYFFRDVVIPSFNRYRKLWYRIRVTRILDDKVAYSEIDTRGPEPDLIALEVRRQELLLFQEHIGRQVWIFPIRTFGQRCPACYDRVQRVRLKSACLTCYNTGFTRGFMDPIVSWVQIDPAVEVTQPGPLMQDQTQNATARLPWFPPLKTGDVIVEAENVRWAVNPVTTTQRLRAPLHQEVTIHHIPESDIEYRLPINIDSLRELQPNPKRVFTNPHHLRSGTYVDLRTDELKGYDYE